MTTQGVLRTTSRDHSLYRDLAVQSAGQRDGEIQHAAHLFAQVTEGKGDSGHAAILKFIPDLTGDIEVNGVIGKMVESEPAVAPGEYSRQRDAAIADAHRQHHDRMAALGAHFGVTNGSPGTATNEARGWLHGFDDHGNALPPIGS